MNSFATLALVAGLASALPGQYGDAPATTTTYACNPAHAYPNGASCISTAGSLTLVTPAASTTYACNPAHEYPNGASCISTAGSLTLVTPAASTTYACNPAHQYPNGASCISTAGSLTLVTPSASATPTGDKATCDAAYDKCRGAPDANFSYCASKYAECLGYNPFTSSAASSSAPATTSTPPKGDEKACYDAYNKCRGAPDANFSFCASKYAECLGYNPFNNNGTNTVTPGKNSDVYTTQVVTKYTTYCPSPTTITYQSKTYTVTEATTLTITDCPCTVTAPVKSNTPAPPPPPPPGTSQMQPPSVTPSTKPGSVIPTGNAPSQTQSAPTNTRSNAPYTGAADKLNVGGALMIGALGLFAL